MKQTENYFLNKLELTDAPPDITVLNPNWDKIDEELKNLNDKTSNLDYLPTEGGVMTGDIQMSDTASIKRVDDSGTLELYGGVDYYDGASLHLMGANATISKGGFQLVTKNDEATATLVGSANGNLSWNGEAVVTAAGATFNGDILMNTGYIKTTDSTNRLELYGGDDYAEGASMFLFGKDYKYSKGTFQLIAKNDDGSNILTGYPNGSLMWASKNIARSVNGVEADSAGNVDIPLVANSKAYVTETWQSGTEWYRIWSDGWVEQGGFRTDTYATVTYLKPFADNNYTLTCSIMNSTRSYTWAGSKAISSKTATNFSYNNEYGAGFSWYACGYGA